MKASMTRGESEQRKLTAEGNSSVKRTYISEHMRACACACSSVFVSGMHSTQSDSPIALETDRQIFF